MCILGGIFIDAVVIQPLTEFIFLSAHPRDSQRLKRIARVFQSLKLALDDLHQFYSGLVLASSDQRFFPYIREYQTDDNTTVCFTYRHPLTDGQTRLVWQAVTDDDRQIVVKFTDQYNVPAHTCCAESGRAPQLLYAGNQERHLGGLRMIVMEYVDGASMAGITEIEPGSYKDIYEDIKSAVDQLHAIDIVFADLREPNILVVKVAEKHRAMLIDFDWCGMHLVDRYPPSMNPQITWPEGAEPGAPLDKAHDHAWLSNLQSAWLGESTATTS